MIKTVLSGLFIVQIVFFLSVGWAITLISADFFGIHIHLHTGVACLLIGLLGAFFFASDGINTRTALSAIIAMGLAYMLDMLL